jgi:hypothetical protein
MCILPEEKIIQPVTGRTGLKQYFQAMVSLMEQAILLLACDKEEQGGLDNAEVSNTKSQWQLDTFCIQHE